MDTATIVNICLSILSFVLAAVSVITVVVALRQNNRMIESSTRPILSFYTTTLSTTVQTLFFVVRNYGASPATIKTISCDRDFSEFLIGAEQMDKEILKKFEPIHQLRNAVIAPGQSRICPLDFSKAPDILHIDVIYTSLNGKHYSEKFDIAVKAGNEMLHVSSGNADHDIAKSAYDISNILNEMLQKNV